MVAPRARTASLSCGTVMVAVRSENVISEGIPARKGNRHRFSWKGCVTNVRSRYQGEKERRAVDWRRSTATGGSVGCLAPDPMPR